MDNENIFKFVGGIALLIALISLIIGIIVFLRKPQEVEDKCFGVVCENGKECIEGECKCLSVQNCDPGDTGYKEDNCGNIYYCGPCQPISYANACSGIICGTASDGCGNVINCNNCSDPNAVCNESDECECKNGYEDGGSGVCVPVTLPTYAIYYGADFYPVDPTFNDIPTAAEIKTLSSQNVDVPPETITLANNTSGFNIPYYAIPSVFGTNISYTLGVLSNLPPTAINSIDIDGVDYTVFQITGGLQFGDPSLVLSDIDYTGGTSRKVIEDREYDGTKVRLPAPITTGGPDSNIPSFDSNNGIGGYHVVNNFSELRLIYQNMRRVGMMVNDISTGILYTLLPGGDVVGPTSFGQKSAFANDPSTNTDNGTLWKPVINSNGSSSLNNLICTTSSCTLNLPLTVLGDIVSQESSIYADDIFIKNTSIS